MTRQEAENILNIGSGYKNTDIDKAYCNKISEWSKRSKAAATPEDKDKCAQMLIKIKEAKTFLQSSSSAKQVKTPVNKPSAKMPPKPVSSASPRPQPAKPVIKTQTHNNPPKAASVAPIQPLNFKVIVKAAAVVLAVLLMYGLLGLPHKRPHHNSSRMVNLDSSSKKPVISIQGCDKADKKEHISSSTRLSNSNTNLSNQSLGYLVVNTFPASTIIINGAIFGYGPFKLNQKKSIPAGTHQLVLQNHKYPSFATSIDISEGQTKEIQYWFDTKEYKEVITR